MEQKLTIYIPQNCWDTVKEIAHVERRSPRQQAEALILEALQRRTANCPEPGDGVVSEAVTNV